MSQAVEAPVPPSVLARQERIDLELKTLKAMIGLYCRILHGSREGICGSCDGVWQYARQRVRHCPFLPDKPTCNTCTVHCYKPQMRQRVREIMRRTGPRMPWHHPILTVLHFIRELSGSPVPRNAPLRG